METLEYSDIMAEIKGCMTPGRLKMTDQNIVFKNNKTGKVEQIGSADMDLVNFQKMVGSWGLRIFLKNGSLYRFSGLKEGEEDKIAKFFKSNYKLDMLEKELSLRGWNWGTVHFNGSVLNFDVETKTSFEIPLNQVSQCTTGKNEVTLEFHQNDDAPVSLLEMRFHIPITETTTETDPVDAFYKNVMNKASVISVSGDAFAIFREIHCLTPRGRYDIKIFQSFFQLHGKTFDYKIPMSTVLRLFLLPHKDSRQMFFVLSLDPPIKQGQTRYHFLVLLFQIDEETTIELPFTDEELQTKYEGKLTKEISGPVYEVLGKVMKILVDRRLTGPGNFIGSSGTPAVGCSYKAAAGYLYPLERGFIYVNKPPVHIRFEEISGVNFARGGNTTRSFDFEIELKTGTVHTFSSIEKEEYNKLFDYIKTKKLRVKNTGKNDGKAVYNDDFGDSDEEKEPDAYLARVKAEGRERESGDSGGSDDESTDEDFNPQEQESDVADEYDSNAQTTDSDAESGAEGGEDGSPKKEKKAKKEPKEKKERKERSAGRKSKSKKANKDVNRPKRPTTAFMIWLNEMREKIKTDNPGISITDVAKKGGELWKELKDKSEWEGKAAKDKERYAEAMKTYVEPVAAVGSDNEKAGGTASGGTKRKKESPTKKSVPTMKGSGFKSKEYISGSDSSSLGDDDDGDGDKKARKKQKKTTASKKDKPAADKSEKEDSSGSGEDEDDDKKDKKKKKPSPKKDKKAAAESDNASEEEESSGGGDESD